MGDSNAPLVGHAGPAAAPPSVNQSIELKIPAAAEWVRVARLTVAGVASRLQFNIEEVEDIKLAVAEAINNAIQHAPLPAGSIDPPVVTVVVQILPEGLVVEVKDGGRIHDGLPQEKETPEVDEEDLPESGMGLLLIRTLMDDVTHETGPHSDTTVRMVKRLPERARRRASGEISLDGASPNLQAGAVPPAAHAGGEGTSSAA